MATFGADDDAAVAVDPGHVAVYCTDVVGSAPGPSYLELLPRAVRDLVDAKLKADAWTVGACLVKFDAADLPSFGVNYHLTGSLEELIIATRQDVCMIFSPTRKPISFPLELDGIFPADAAHTEPRLCGSSQRTMQVRSLQGDVLASYADASLFCEAGKWALRGPRVQSLLNPDECYAIGPDLAASIAEFCVFSGDRFSEPTLALQTADERLQVLGLVTGKVHSNTDDPKGCDVWWVYRLGLVALVSPQRIRIYDAADGRDYTLAMEATPLSYSEPLRRVWFVDRGKQRAFYFDATQRAFAEFTLPGYDACRVGGGGLLEFDTRRPMGRVPYVYDPATGLGFVAPSSEQRAHVWCHAGTFFLGVRAPNQSMAVYIVPPSPLPTAKSTPRPELRKFVGVAASTEFYFSEPQGPGCNSFPPLVCAGRTFHRIRARPATSSVS